jgi:signal peptidase I
MDQLPTNMQSPEPVLQRGWGSEAIDFIWETAKVVLVSLAIILPVRYYLIQPFFVQGSSMVPNFENHQYILVDKWTYELGRPERGDVIVFKYPGDPSEYFIKRIIGLPGETIFIPGDNTIHIFNDRYPNGFILDERSYLPASNPTYCSGNSTWCGRKVTLGPDEYFVMGDNREHSSDSRFFGPVDRAQFFSGLAWLRLWPLNQIGFIPQVQYPPVAQ